MLFMGLIYPKEDFYNISRKCKKGMQMQVDQFQQLIIGAIEKSPLVDSLDVCNALPVGVFPKYYKDIYLKAEQFGNISNLPSLNLPYFKQRGREKKAYAFLKLWIEKHPFNRDILVYSLYLPYLRALAQIKKEHPDVHMGVIVPDIPTELGLSSGRKGLMKAIENKRGKACVKLCKNFDYAMLLTEPMKYVLPLNAKAQHVVVEGIAPNELDLPSPNLVQKTYLKYNLPQDKTYAVYTGTVQKELGILDMVKAFESKALQDVHLVIAGGGQLEVELRKIARLYNNIHYLGFVPRETALCLQMGADVLINPRQNTGAYTRYSFPSKTMEYMLSTKPVLCYKLDGIPSDYDKHLHYIGHSLVESIQNILNIPKETLDKQGLEARYFVLEHKNADAQVAKILKLFQQAYIQ